jgi:hypothetical protein
MRNLLHLSSANGYNLIEQELGVIAACRAAGLYNMRRRRWFLYSGTNLSPQTGDPLRFCEHVCPDCALPGRRIVTSFKWYMQDISEYIAFTPRYFIWYLVGLPVRFFYGTRLGE